VPSHVALTRRLPQDAPLRDTALPSSISRRRISALYVFLPSFSNSLSVQFASVSSPVLSATSPKFGRNPPRSVPTDHSPTQPLRFPAGQTRTAGVTPVLPFMLLPCSIEVLPRRTSFAMMSLRDGVAVHWPFWPPCYRCAIDSKMSSELRVVVLLK
jgi:hypothetical protein